MDSTRQTSCGTDSHSCVKVWKTGLHTGKEAANCAALLEDWSKTAGIYQCLQSVCAATDAVICRGARA